MCNVAGDDATEATTKEAIMLWTIFVVLVVLWALGFVSGYAIGGFIHLLLVIAVVVLLIQLIQGRSSI
jgi:fatty acid desaturase